MTDLTSATDAREVAIKLLRHATISVAKASRGSTLWTETEKPLFFEDTSPARVGITTSNHEVAAKIAKELGGSLDSNMLCSRHVPGKHSKDQVFIEIDILAKKPALVEKIAKELEKHALGPIPSADGSIIVETEAFDPTTLATIERYQPRTPAAIVAGGAPDRRLAAVAYTNDGKNDGNRR